MSHSENLDQKPLILKVSFGCLYASDFEIDVELIDENRVLGLENGWQKAIEHYCPDNIERMKKQLKRKLGSIYNFDDISNIVLRFKNANGKRDEITVQTNYATIGLD